MSFANIPDRRAPSWWGGVMCLRWGWLGMLVLGAAMAAPIEETLTTAEKRDLQREGRLIVDLLQNLHYADRQFYQIEGKEMVDAFIERLDADKLIFLREDVEFLHRRFDRSLKNVYLLKGDHQPAWEIFERYRMRVRQRVAWVRQQLEREVDLTAKEVLAELADGPWAASEGAAEERWGRRLKEAVMQERLAGREPAEARKQVGRSSARWEKQVEATSAIEVREQFLESLIGLFDPHSGYFSPEHAEEFQIMMKGTVAGIGVDVWMDKGRCLVADVLEAGPADVQGELQSGDEIVALAEGDGAWTALAGKRLPQIVALLRGPADSRLRMEVRRGAGPERRELELIRQETVLLAERARGGIAELPGRGDAPSRIGWVNLPDFYAAGEGPEAVSATRDVRELLEQMKASGIDGLVVDLRRNPGGAMSEAVALTGLFIPAGTVLVTRDVEGLVAEEKVPPGGPVWSGPLVVLTTSRSASASEIFAGAMQFHRRAIVAGGARTYGKGTAQTYIDLNRSPAHQGVRLPWGTLRVTGQRFYLPDGRSPQAVGISADIVFDPELGSEAKYEGDLPHALPGEAIARPAARRAAGDFAPITEVLTGALRRRTAIRQGELSEFELKRRGQELVAEITKQETFSLNLEQRRREQEQRDARWSAWRRDSRNLAPTAAFAEKELAIARVAAVLEKHRALAWGRRPAEVAGREGWLRGGVFFIGMGPDDLKEVRLRQIEFRRYAAEADELAAALAAASGATLAPDELVSALREVSLLEHLTDEAVLASFGRRMPAGSEAITVRRGVEAVLRRMTELDPDLLQARPQLDVSLREGLRLAADWAQEPAGNSAGGP